MNIRDGHEMMASIQFVVYRRDISWGAQPCWCMAMILTDAIMMPIQFINKFVRSSVGICAIVRIRGGGELGRQ